MGLKRRQRVEPEFSLAAMIDVIFLLLMFFMLTSNFVTTNALNLQLPSSSSTSMASPSLTLSIDASRNFYLEVDGRQTKIPRTNLESTLASKVRVLGKDPKEVTLNVAADKTAPTEDLIDVLDAANKLKIKTIISTNKKE
jgi:biopolymer transport protein ExbD